MSKLVLTFTFEAKNDLEKLNKDLKERVIKKLDWLQINFDKISPSALSNEWRGFFKLRVGDWRVIYKIDWNKNLIIIYVIGRRDKVYKKRKY